MAGDSTYTIMKLFNVDQIMASIMLNKEGVSYWYTYHALMSEIRSQYHYGPDFRLHPKEPLKVKRHEP